MDTYAHIVARLNVAVGGTVNIGDDPPLAVSRNAASLIAALNAGVHITIFQNSWDGQAQITDADGEQVTVGPYCLHLTAGQSRWFRQYQNGSWEWVTDYGEPNARSVQAFDSMMNTLGPELAAPRVEVHSEVTKSNGIYSNGFTLPTSSVSLGLPSKVPANSPVHWMADLPVAWLSKIKSVTRVEFRQ